MLDFCFGELEALAGIAKVPLSDLYGVTGGQRPKINLEKTPYVRVYLPSEECVKEIVMRSILIKDICQIIGVAPSVETLEHDQDNRLLAL